MIWREQHDHVTDCYFCTFSIKGISDKNRKQIVYPSLLSAIRPVVHSLELPVLVPPTTISSPDTNSNESSSDDVDTSYEPSDASSAPHIRTTGELNDLVRDLQLTKNQSELLASRLQGWNLLNADAKVTYFRKRTADLTHLFTMSGELCYCNDIPVLFTKFGIEHDAHEWRLFIDASKYSIKAVLLHNGNVHPSVPVAYSVTMRETYQNLN